MGKITSVKRVTLSFKVCLVKFTKRFKNDIVWVSVFDLFKYDGYHRCTFSLHFLRKKCDKMRQNDKDKMTRTKCGFYMFNV